MCLHVQRMGAACLLSAVPHTRVNRWIILSTYMIFEGRVHSYSNAGATGMPVKSSVGNSVIHVHWVLTFAFSRCSVT